MFDLSEIAAELTPDGDQVAVTPLFVEKFVSLMILEAVLSSCIKLSRLVLQEPESP